MKKQRTKSVPTGFSTEVVIDLAGSKGTVVASTHKAGEVFTTKHAVKGKGTTLNPLSKAAIEAIGTEGKLTVGTETVAFEVRPIMKRVAKGEKMVATKLSTLKASVRVPAPDAKAKALGEFLTVTVEWRETEHETLGTRFLPYVTLNHTSGTKGGGGRKAQPAASSAAGAF